MFNRVRGYRTVEAASVELRLAEITIYRAIAAGHIPAVKINRNWRIPASYFDDLEREAYSHFEEHSPASEDARPARGRPRTQRAVMWTDTPTSPLTVMRPAPAISQPSIRRVIRQGRIPAVEVAGEWRIPASFFEELEARAYGRIVGRKKERPR